MAFKGMVVMKIQHDENKAPPYEEKKLESRNYFKWDIINLEFPTKECKNKKKI